MMKKHESNKEALEDIKAEIVKISPILNAILDRTEGNAKASGLMTNHCAPGLRLDEMFANISEIKEKVEPLDASRIDSEMNQLNIRIAELEKHHRNAPPAPTHQAPTQPLSRKTTRGKQTTIRDPILQCRASSIVPRS
ncbi:unnamed protein product [Heligmosomoides polygyrus]|uniref:t-SNARE coiled-coil homology domain-containing protein n=1 Tax=Heligmosomoides polygyrus TaxID=6339 RepID=A0A183G467_HELPZ|nr:unnamed protein product [Heligmosomoides polygyrus]